MWQPDLVLLSTLSHPGDAGCQCDEAEGSGVLCWEECWLLLLCISCCVQDGAQ